MTNHTPAKTKPGTGPNLDAGFALPPISRLEDTGLSQLWLQDLVLKVLYFQGYLTGFRIAEEVAAFVAHVAGRG